MKEKLEKYLELEYKTFKRSAENLDYSDFQTEQKNSIYRGYGAAMFAQDLGLSFEDARDLFDTFKTKIKNLAQEIE